MSILINNQYNKYNIIEELLCIVVISSAEQMALENTAAVMIWMSWLGMGGTGGNSDKSTHQIGSKQANNFGLYDMSENIWGRYGNVWDWCSDWYRKDYYASGAKDNPTGPDADTYRVLQGGKTASTTPPPQQSISSHS